MKRSKPAELSRTRLRTRRRIIDAALRVMSAKGVDGATVAEIVAEAEVGFGSFYGNFASLAELASEAFAYRSEALAQALEQIALRVADPALAASFIQRHLIDTAVHDRVWGWFLVRADTTIAQLESTYRTRILSDIELGVRAGRYQVGCPDTVATITLASIIAVTRRILEGKAGPESATHMVQGLLVLYGLTFEEAQRLSQTPLPDWIGPDSHAQVAAPPQALP